MSLNDGHGEQVAFELREAGLKATPQRRAILGYLSGHEGHPTAQQIFEDLAKKHPSLSFATVYNTLAALQRVGRLGSLKLGGATRFDPNVTPHHHAVCDHCGAVRDVDGEIEETRRIADFVVRRVERIYRGSCSRCRAERSE